MEGLDELDNHMKIQAKKRFRSLKEKHLNEQAQMVFENKSET